jgi:hypothetical protein
MQKCFYFPTWEEKKDALVSLDESKIVFTEQHNIAQVGSSINHPLYSNMIQPQTTVSFEGLKDVAKAYLLTNPSDPILAKLCELTGAKAYGDYVVLEEIICYDDLIFTTGDCNIESYKEKDRLGYEEVIKYKYSLLSYGCLCGNLHNINKENLYNIFHEYSKFLRNEESKWEEVKKVLEI